MRFAGIVFRHGNNLAECSRDNTFQLLIVWNSHHSVSFAATCLSVCEYCSIVSIQDTINQGKSALLVDEVLRRLSTEHFVIRKAFGRLVIVFSDEVDLIIFIVNFNDIYAG